MKITCDNCGAKYSIADEKVRGKVFKIRCKRCSNIVVVRGDQPGAAAAGQDEGGAGETPVWHVVIGREQVGPITPAEIRERFARGELNADSYIWRDGFADWVRINTVDEFADMAQATAVAQAPQVAQEAAAAAQEAAAQEAAPAAQEPAQQPAEAAAEQDMAGYTAGQDTQQTPAALFGQDEDPRPDLFGGVSEDSNVAAAADVNAAPAEGGGADDLFSDSRKLFPDDGQAAEQPQAAAASGGGMQMTGQRGENSVLFSLANLQALATGGQTAAAPSSPAASSLPSNEGSALIDIRAMAAAAAAKPTLGGPTTTGADAAEDDPLAALGGFGGAPGAAPVLMPVAGSDRPKWLFPVLGGVVGLLLITIIVLAVRLMGSDDKPPAVAQNTAKTGEAPPAAAAAKKPVVAKPETPEPKKAAAAETDPPKPAVEPKKDPEPVKPAAKPVKLARATTSRRKTGRSRPRRTTRRRSSDVDSLLGATKTPKRKKPRRKGDAIDNLISGALGSGKKKPRGRSPSRASNNDNLQKKLSKGDIVKGMRAIKGKVQRCYDKFKVPGMAKVRVEVASNGKVRGIKVKGVFSGTPTGSCVASAVRRARFARFSSDSTSFTYPFMLR